MGDIQNTLAWSVSTEKDWKECRRRVAIKKLAAWGGWERDAPPDRQLAYRLGKIEPFAAVVGSVIHQAIADLLAAKTRPNPDGQEHFTEAALASLRRYWTASKKGQWFRNPKAPRLLEHHYDLWLPDEDAKKMAERVRACLGWFYQMPTLDGLLFREGAELLDAEQLVEFDVGGQLCYAKLDLTLLAPTLPPRGKPDQDFTPETRLHIIDWKTGRRREADQSQVAVYAVAVQRAVSPGPGVAYQGITGHTIYLLTQEHFGGATSQQAVDLVEEHITQFAADPEWQLLKAMVDGQEPENLGAFPITSRQDVAACWQCPFFEFCFGTAEQGKAHNAVFEGKAVKRDTGTQ